MPIFQKKFKNYYCVFNFVAGTKLEHEFLNIIMSKTTHMAANSTLLNPIFQL